MPVRAKKSVRRTRVAALFVAILALLVAGAVWYGAVDHWMSGQLRVLAAAYLEPSFDFEELVYIFPRSARVRDIRLTSPGPDGPSDRIDILEVDSLTLVLGGIPMPGQPFSMERIELVHPTLRLVARAGEQGGLVGFSNLLKERSKSAAPAAQRRAKLSDYFQVRTVTIEDGSGAFDPRDGSAAVMLIDGIHSKLLLEPSRAGVYDIDLSLEDPPGFAATVHGEFVADEARLEAARLSLTLEVEREQDHYLTPAVQKYLAERDITGSLKAKATGAIDFNDASSQLHAQVEVTDATYALGDHLLTLDRGESRLSFKEEILSIESLDVEALGGHAQVHGTIPLDEQASGELVFQGSELQIRDLQRGPGESNSATSFEGLLAFSGVVRGPFASIDQHAEGNAQLSIQKAKLANIPLLSSIDEALDRAAEAAMKHEAGRGHDRLRLSFGFEGDRIHISKLRMNSRWYGLRGKGDVSFDSDLDLVVDGGPLVRLENEQGVVGDEISEISQTILRARVKGTVNDPKIVFEVLRHRILP